MPVQTFAEFEREWPWLTHEEAELRVTMGDHTMNICDVRETAADMGYEEWYYSNTIRERRGRPMHRSMETLAFQKKTDDDGEGNAVVTKILYYISSGSIAACTFRQNPFPLHAPVEPEVFSTRLGIFPPSEENSDFAKPDALFNPYSDKSYAMFLGVTTRKELEAILADPPSALQKIKGAHQFQRRNGYIWDPPEDCKMSQHFGCFLFDCNLRWHHLNCASGLLWSVHKIDDICYLMEDTLFERGPASLTRTRHACGSYCAILELLMDIGKEHHNAIGYTSTRTAIKMLEGWLTDPVRDYNYGTGFGYACEMKPSFLAAGYGKSLMQLKEYFLALPNDIRLEMLQFFFERTSSRSHGGEGLTMIDHNFKPLWSPCTYASRARVWTTLDCLLAKILKNNTVTGMDCITLLMTKTRKEAKAMERWQQKHQVIHLKEALATELNIVWTVKLTAKMIVPKEVVAKELRFARTVWIFSIWG